MSTIDCGCNYHRPLFHVTFTLCRVRAHRLLAVQHKIAMMQPGTPIKWAISFARQRDAEPRFSHEDRARYWPATRRPADASSYYERRAQVARAVWTRSVPDSGRDSLEKRSPLATGHPLTRIRVFNSASEENEEECDREREREREGKKERGGVRNENGGDRTLARTALQPIGWIVTISSPTRTKIYTSILTIASRVITLIWKFHGVSSKVLHETRSCVKKTA